MAWYYGTFTCGCEGRVNVIGKMDQRQWKIDKAFSKDCEKCFRIAFEKEKAENIKKSKEMKNEYELPQLAGSQRQIEWATSLRVKFIEDFEKQFINDTESKYILEFRDEIINKFELINGLEDFQKILDYIILNKDDSRHYIDYRSYSLSTIIDVFYKDIFKTKEEIIREIERKELIEKGSVSPKNKMYDGIVNITFSKDTGRIIADYHKDYNFIDIVKGLKYRWDGKWERKIKSKTQGKLEDRVAELGNKLLKEGYTISILDDSVREKAINGDYEREISNWILVDDLKDNYIKVSYPGRSDLLYNAARKIKNSIYKEHYVRIRISSFKEIRDFANIYDFKIDGDADKLLKNYENQYNSIEKVDVISKEEIKKEDKLENILNSSREIINDLLDD